MNDEGVWFHLHDRLVLAYFSSPFHDALNKVMVWDALAVHELIKRRSRGALHIEVCLFRLAGQTPFHGALEAFFRRCIFRHGDARG